MKLTIEMPWERDLSVNSYRFGKPSPKAKGKWKKRRVRKPHVQAWMQRCASDIYVARIEAEGLFSAFPCCASEGSPVVVRIDFRFPDKRRRDTHNYFKVICDAVASSLGIDDKDIRISTRSVTVDSENPGFTIEVRDER